MLDRVKNYINDNDFKITIYENKVHIMNYKLLISIDKNYISLKSYNKKIKITGDKLIPKKLLDNEILLIGNINKIEVDNE